MDKNFYDNLEKIMRKAPKDFDALKLSLAQCYIMRGFEKLPMRHEEFVR